MTETAPAERKPLAPGASKSARDLSVDAVLERIGRYAHTASARAAILATVPFAERKDAEREHTWVREALALTELGAALPIRQTNELTSVIQSLRASAVVSGTELFDCRLCLEQALLLSHHTTGHSTACPTLGQALWIHKDVADLIAPLRSALDEDGQLFDHASSGLLAARSELSRAREVLRQEQAALVQRYKAQLSGAYFAEREGRFVLPLRADAERIDGTILGTSGSGSTLYVEPQELTKHNNRLRLAEARVHQEEQALLSQLSDLVRGRLSDLIQASDNCLLGDRIAAIATWATRTTSIPTLFEAEPTLELVQVRHPLLISTDPATASVAIPNDIELNPGRALILSGPNAGGKTVALQCLGLAVWLSKSGLPVPCANTSRIGWFSHVLTDIGDDQSVIQSLSTFSSHIVRLAHCLECADKGVLILLDEVAAGTDPDEGAALAEALLRALIATKASVATTTHYPRLKQLGAVAEVFSNASVGFDLDTMQPTFRITMGVPGVSSGLAVAQRFGISVPVVNAARALLPKEHQLQQHLLQRISQELDKTAANRDASDALLQETQRNASALEAEHQRALQGDRLALEKMRAELTQEVKQARADLQRAKALLVLQTKDSYREAESLVNQAALPITVEGNLTRALRPPTPPRSPQLQTLAPGMTVHLTHLGMEGQVLEAPSKGQVRVSVGGLKMSVPVTQLGVAKQGATTPVAKSAKSARKHDASSAPNYAGAMRTLRNTCDLRGKRVDQGLSEMDAFIDQMLQINEPAAFVLHGHGTGAMKAAVREHLAASPVVRHFEAANPEHGGDAFTVVWLS